MTLLKRVALLEYVILNDLVNNKLEVNLVDLVITCDMHHDTSLFLTVLAMILHLLLIPDAKVKKKAFIWARRGLNLRKSTLE